MLKTFRIGGIHPKENKFSAGKSIETIAIPKQVIVPLAQHIGAPCQPVVKRGDEVKVELCWARALALFQQTSIRLYRAK